ncbi:MAG: MFS transporter [Spirochaetaceae bacterium]|nr:MFS transporter [Spirochaetaceae bacterium]
MSSLKIKNKLGYGFGDLANGLTFGMSSTFLLAFYTDVLGITAVAAGTLFLVARIWDAVNDPMMGALADKLFQRRLARGKTGKSGRTDKFRPYLIKGSWPVVAAAILMFIAPGSMGTTQKLIWAYATYITWGMAYTFINIPYGSLAAVMTQDPVERSSLSVFRGLGGMIGGISIRIVVPAMLIANAGNDARGYLMAMIILGAVSLAGYIASYFMTEEKVETKPEAAVAFSFKSTFSVLWKNRPFLAVSLASIAMLTGLMVNGAMNIYYFREVLNSLELMGLTAIITLIPMLAAAVVIPKLVKRYGTKKLSWFTSLMSAVLMTILLILPSNPWIYIGMMLFATLFLMIPNIIVWGQVSDCIDYNQYLSGSRQEGVIYGAYSFMRKMGQAFAGFIAGAGLGLVGYVANAESQSPGTIAGIKILTIGLPAVAMFIAFLSYYFIWNLTPEKQAEVTAAISIQNGKNS